MKLCKPDCDWQLWDTESINYGLNCLLRLWRITQCHMLMYSVLYVQFVDCFTGQAFSTAAGRWTKSCLHYIEDTCLQSPRKPPKVCK